MPHQDYRVCLLDVCKCTYTYTCLKNLFLTFCNKRTFFLLTPPLSLSLYQQSVVDNGHISLLQSRIGQSRQAVELEATPQRERSIRAKVKPITIIILLHVGTIILIIKCKLLSPALMMLMCPSL